jgi:hypothetical protein
MWSLPRNSGHARRAVLLPHPFRPGARVLNVLYFFPKKRLTNLMSPANNVALPIDVLKELLLPGDGLLLLQQRMQSLAPNGFPARSVIDREPRWSVRACG